SSLVGPVAAMGSLPSVDQRSLIRELTFPRSGRSCQGSDRSKRIERMAHASHGASTRKVVTVLFTDITGSTALGESLDPEPLERILSRYFAEMQAVIERHGGLVTKFIGDAVMAIFGLPASHEDDALRAVRAAVDMRARIEILNEEFASSLGV